MLSISGTLSTTLQIMFKSWSFLLQVRKTLKMLEDDLGAHISRNCTLLDDNLCVQI